LIWELRLVGRPLLASTGFLAISGSARPVPSQTLYLVYFTSTALVRWGDAWRPALFEDKGLLALVRLDKLPRPPLPEIDEDATQRENEILCVSRERVAKAISNGEKLTLEDCLAIAETVGAELCRHDGLRSSANLRPDHCSARPPEASC
jgi:hypothetical protein